MRVPHPAGVQENYPGSAYTDDEREFLVAIDRYKRERNRPHPTLTEVLRVVRSLGYRKIAPTRRANRPPREDR